MAARRHASGTTLRLCAAGRRWPGMAGLGLTTWSPALRSAGTDHPAASLPCADGNALNRGGSGPACRGCARCRTRAGAGAQPRWCAVAGYRTMSALSWRRTSSPITGAPGSSPATSSPPDVCASASRSRSSSPTVPASACGRTQSRFRRLPPGTCPACAAARVPSMSGTAAWWTTAETPLALASLNRWPSSPEPGHIGRAPDPGAFPMTS